MTLSVRTPLRPSPGRRPAVIAAPAPLPPLPRLSDRPDFTRLGFAFTPTDAMFVAETNARGAWQPGALRPFGDIPVSPASAVFNHAQSVFEGLKAQRTVEGDVVLFRPSENGRRFQRGAERLCLPPVPCDLFVAAVEAVVAANARWVPPVGLGSLYLRPVLMGSGPIMGVMPAERSTFYVYACPVGAYLPGEGRVVVLPGAHRALPNGTGDVKVAGNYAPTFRTHRTAMALGYKDVLYLDAVHGRWIEELGSSNFFAVLRDGTLVTPSLGAVLPGITRDSVLALARERFGWSVAERELTVDEVVADAQEAFFTGTAAVVQPITTVHHAGRDHAIGDGLPGHRTALLRQALVQIQTRVRPDPFGWLHPVPAIGPRDDVRPAADR